MRCAACLALRNHHTTDQLTDSLYCPQLDMASFSAPVEQGKPSLSFLLKNYAEKFVPDTSFYLPDFREPSAPVDQSEYDLAIIYYISNFWVATSENSNPVEDTLFSTDFSEGVAFSTRNANFGKLLVFGNQTIALIICRS